MERCSHHWCIRLWSVTISFFPSVHVCPSCDACWPMLGDRSFWMVLISTLFTPFLKRQQHFLGLSNSAPTSAPSEKSSSGMKHSPTWSASFFFPFLAFFSLLHYFFFFLLGTVFFVIMFFLVPPLTPNLFWEPPTSPSHQPTHLLLHSPPLLELEN
jgi:hypothetical protein